MNLFDKEYSILQSCVEETKCLVSDMNGTFCYDQTPNLEEEEEKPERNPFSPKCRIPLPDLYGNCAVLDSSTFIRRRNERERTRVRNVNDGFEKLRNHLPLLSNQREKRLSKVETLRYAISYIKHLQELLECKSIEEPTAFFDEFEFNWVQNFLASSHCL